MTNKHNHENHDPLINVENVLGETGNYLGKHQKLIIYFVVGIAILVGGYFGYKFLYLEPLEKTASSEMFYAERYFEMDSMQMALNGDKEHLGFLDVIDNYSPTEAANLSHYYAGIAYLQLGKFEDAVKYLEKFKTSDPLLYPISRAAIADAYLEMGDTDKALKEYMKAADYENNEYVTPGILLRAALLYEKNKNYKEALKIYERIQKDFTTSVEAREMDRYIGRVKELLGE